MNFEYTGRHIEVTPALRTHFENHFNRLDHLFEDSATKVHVIIEASKGRHRSAVIVKWRESVLTAESTVADMYQSLTKTVDKIEKQALKIKNKVIDKHQKATKITTVAEKKNDNVEISEPKIVAVTRYPVKPMTDEEAVLRLKAEENQFIVFRDAETERVSVMFRRKDGNFGLIQP